MSARPQHGTGEAGARWLLALPQQLPPRGPGEARSWAGQGSPKDPKQGSGDPSPGLAGGRVRSTQGSHSARAAGSAAEATATIDQSRAGESVTEEPPRSPSKHGPSWAGRCKGWEDVTGEGLCCST